MKKDLLQMPNVQNALALLMSLSCTYVLPRIVPVDTSNPAIGNSILNVLFFAGVFLLIRKALRIQTRRLALHAAVPALLFSLCMSVGRDLTVHGDADFSLIGWVWHLGTAVLFAPVFFAAVVLLLNSAAQDDPAPVGKWFSLRTFLPVWCVLVLFWTPIFLAYYPAIWSYDTNQETAQFFGSTPVTMNTPPLHTLMACGFLKLGELVFRTYPAGVALYAVCQMLLFSAACAYVCTYAARRFSLPKAIGIACVLFFALLPVHGMLAVSCVKDAMYAATMACSLWRQRRSHFAPICSKTKAVGSGSRCSACCCASGATTA